MIAGDFFQSVPAGGDLYLLKFILHDWDDEHAIKILSNVRRGIDPKGRLGSSRSCCRRTTSRISGRSSIST